MFKNPDIRGIYLSMNIIAVDDEIFALDDLESVIKEACQETDIKGISISRFDVSRNALEYAKTNQVDLAFLDIEMSGINGLQLAKQRLPVFQKAAKSLQPVRAA